MTKDPDLLDSDLTNAAIEHKSRIALKAQMERVFKNYCGDMLAQWARDLAEDVKRRNLVGLHAFTVADRFSDKNDIVSAVLVCALLPNNADTLLRNMDGLIEVMGGSPWAFVQGGYKVTEIGHGVRYGVMSSTLQEWVDILHEVMVSFPQSEWLRGLKRCMAEREFKVPVGAADSFEDAVFWLSEHVPGFETDQAYIPSTKNVRAFVEGLVPRSKLLTLREAVDMFKFERPCDVWYAAEGRMRIYETNYKAIWRMEHNLKAKVMRSTPIRAHERYVFKTQILGPCVIND